MVRGFLREAEVEHLYRSVRRDDDVRRFQVAVDNPALVGRIERVGELARDRNRLSGGHAVTPIADAVGQRLALDQLEDEPGDAVGLFESVNRRDVRVIERRQQPRLAIEAGDARRVAGERVG